MNTRHVIGSMAVGALIVVLIGCSDASSDRTPATDPDIRGKMTKIDVSAGATRILVEENPADSTISSKAEVRLLNTTRVWERLPNGLREVSRSALAEGGTVSVWYDGPVLMSHPARGGARVIVIEKR